MKTLIELYSSAAQSIGIVSDNQGFMSTLLPGADSPKPWVIEQKRVVLPVEEQLKQHDWSGRIGFHPLLQNVASGESRVMEKFRERMNAYGDFTLGMLFHDIGKLALKEEMHKDMSPPQAMYLVPFQDADARFVKLLYDLVTTKRISKKNHEFVHFTVIKGRVWNGQKRSRVAGMHFPLYEKLPTDNKGTSLLGFTLRQKDVRMLRAMYHMLFTYIDSQAEREFGTDSKIGPSFESLMTVYGKFAEEINKAVSILEPVIDSSTALLIVNDWRDDITHVDQLMQQIRHIPMLEGNAPSERVMQADAPARIGDGNMPAAITPVQIMATTHSAPVITAAMAQTSQLQQGTQEVQQQPQNVTPRFKLGSSSPTITDHNPNHQLPNTVGNVQPTVIGYARPAPSAIIPPTPPVGAMLAQSQQQHQPQQQTLGLGQAQFAGNVLQGQTNTLQTPQVMKLPDTVRMVNGVMYIPLEANGVSAMPAGAIIIDNRPYVPFQQMGAAPAVGTGFAPAVNRFGQPQQQVTDPGQVPGLTAEEVNFYRSNPVMWQNMLSQLQVAGASQAAAVAAARQTQVPRYLQNAVQTAQQQQQSNVGFFPRGGTIGLR